MYSSQKITRQLIAEIKDAIKNVGRYGSVELYIQDGAVTQITVRRIKKTNSTK